MKERKWTPCLNEKAILSLSQKHTHTFRSLFLTYSRFLHRDLLFLSTESVTRSTHIRNIKRKIGIEKSRSTCIHIRFSITTIKFTTATREMDPEVFTQRSSIDRLRREKRWIFLFLIRNNDARINHISSLRDYISMIINRSICVKETNALFISFVYKRKKKKKNIPGRGLCRRKKWEKCNHFKRKIIYLIRSAFHVSSYPYIFRHFTSFTLSPPPPPSLTFNFSPTRCSIALITLTT